MEPAMQVDVTVPEIDEADDVPIVVGYWFAREGETVLAGDELVEVVCDKTVFTVTSPVTGTVARILADDEDIVHVGDRLAVIETTQANDDEAE
jgi:pyruvate/2-oxoglutarate dehydrogenase complex dihydrolipoamide acyltransferase (E2) component